MTTGRYDRATEVALGTPPPPEEMYVLSYVTLCCLTRYLAIMKTKMPPQKLQQDLQRRVGIVDLLNMKLLLVLRCLYLFPSVSLSLSSLFLVISLRLGGLELDLDLGLVLVLTALLLA